MLICMHAINVHKLWYVCVSILGMRVCMRNVCHLKVLLQLLAALSFSNPKGEVLCYSLLVIDSVLLYIVQREKGRLICAIILSLMVNIISVHV